MAAATVTESVARPSAGRLAVFVLALYAILGGALTLVGWALGVPRLADWLGNGISMKANPALCVVLCAVALLLGPPRRLAVRALAGFVALVALLTLFEHATGTNLGIDTLLVAEPPGARATAAPGRMGVPGSVSLALISAALVLALGPPGARRVASGLGLTVVLIALNSIVGYAFGASVLFTVPQLTGIALQTATMLAALGLGVVAAIPESGLYGALSRPDPGGLMLRRLVVPIVAVPLVAGYLRVWGERAGLYDSAFGTAVFVLAIIGSTLALVAWTASGIGRLSDAERQAREALKEANGGLERAVEERTAELVAKIGELEGFCYSVSHDMRAPLRAIVSNAYMVLEDEAGRVSPEGEARLGSLSAAATKMSCVVDDLLRYARLGATEPARQPCDLSDTARRVADEVLLDRGDEGAAVEIEPNLGHECDPRLVGLVLHNLIDNALKYRAKGRPVCVEIGRAPDGAFFVRDNGIGFDMAYAERVFAPSSGSTATRSSSARASASPTFGASWSGTAAAFGPRARPGWARPFTSPSVRARQIRNFF